MDEASSVRVPVTCDCGHKFEVSIAGKDLQTLEFTCDSCGTVDRFTPDQISTIVAQYEAAKAELLRDAREQFSQGLRDAVRGKKGFTYRPGRR